MRLIKQPKYCQGFTLIELLAVVAILALIAAVLVPRFSNQLVKSQLTAASNQAHAALVFARTEAKRLKTPITVCVIASSSSSNCSTTGKILGVIQRDILLKEYKIGSDVSASIEELISQIDFQSLGNRELSDKKVYIDLMSLKNKDMNKQVEVCFNGRILTRKTNGTTEC